MLEREFAPRTKPPEPKEEFENTHYSDKGGHRDRSIANDPKHIKHWQKENNKWKK